MEKKEWKKPELKKLQVSMTAENDWWALGLLFPVFRGGGGNGRSSSFKYS